jgi:hypothetical protein
MVAKKWFITKWSMVDGRWSMVTNSPSTKWSMVDGPWSLKWSILMVHGPLKMVHPETTPSFFLLLELPKVAEHACSAAYYDFPIQMVP